MAMFILPNLKYLLLCISILNCFNISCIAKATKQDDLKNIKIISAEKLTYKDKLTKLEGAVEVQLDDLLISAPEVHVKDNEFAEFLHDVKVKSEKLNVVAKYMEMDLVTGIIKIHSGITEIKSNNYSKKSPENTTEIKNDNNPDVYNIDADLQTINYKTGLFNAKSNHKPITVLHKDMIINSDEMFGQFDSEKKDSMSNSKLENVIFVGSVNAKRPKSEIRSHKLILFPQKKLYRAITDASFTYLEPNKEFRLQGDFLNLEELEPNKYVILTSSNSAKRLITFTAPKRKLRGKSKFARLWLENEEATEIVFTGNCDIRSDDKRILGEEVYLDNVNKKAFSNLERPKTIILKEQKKQNKKVSK